MHPLLAPLLAQLVTLGLGARSETRYTATEVDDYFEKEASAAVGLALTVPHFSLSAGYSPTLLLTPLEGPSRELRFYDAAVGTASAGYDFRVGRGTLSLGQRAGYTLQNPRFQALAGPTPLPAPATPAPNAPDPGTGTPTPDPAANARRAADYRVQVWTLDSSADLNYPLSRRSTFGAGLNYSLTGGGFGRSRREYPLVQGPGMRLSLATRVTARDTLATLFNAAYAWNEPIVRPGSTVEVVNKSSVSTLEESWSHTFNSRTQSVVSGGVAYTTNQVNDGFIQHSILPTGSGSLTYADRLGGGLLTLSGRIGVAPALDLTTASVDPRLSVGIGAGWTRRRFSLTADGSAAISVDGDDQGAINSVNTNLVAGYDLGAGFSAEAGARGAWQTFEDTTIIPPAAALFVAINWTAGLPLIHPTPGGNPASTTSGSENPDRRNGGGRSTGNRSTGDRNAPASGNPR